MKKIFFITFAAFTALTACNRFGNKDNKTDLPKRMVVISKQYNEIIWELGAQQNVVGVDLSSIYPPEIKKLPTVGYHRALSTEGILSLKPDLIVHDNSVGPESVMQQMEALKIPSKSFTKDSGTIEGTKRLVREMGAYFNREHEADSLCNLLDAQMQQAMAQANYTDTPTVAVIHFGRIGEGRYLVMTNKGTAGKIVEWAGGKMVVEGEKGMMPLSAEVFLKANPDIILVTDFGFDRLGGTTDKVMELPGVAETNAAKNKRIYRVWEQDIVYMGPRTGQVVMDFQKLIHPHAPTQ